MIKKETEQKRKRGRPRNAETNPKSPEFKRKSFGEEIIKLYLADPSRTNVSIARKVGCDESTVRQYLKGKYREKVDEALREYYGREIFALQNKAFKRLNDLLDDPKTPPHTIAAICKFLLEKWIVDPKEEKADVVEFETIISDSGTLQRIERKVYERKEQLGEKFFKDTNNRNNMDEEWLEEDTIIEIPNYHSKD